MPKYDIDDVITEITSGLGRLPKARRPVFLKTLQMIADVVETATHPRDNKAKLKPPVRRLSEREIRAVIARGKQTPWSGRDADEKRNAFEWTRDEYARWIPGLLQNHLRTADFALWQSLQTRIARDGRPDWLDVPSIKENKDRAAAYNPYERDARALYKALATCASQIRRGTFL